MRIALLIQYDGSNYFGWQIQTDPQTVQGVLEVALHKIFDAPSGLYGSGRTDSGVHALGQVAHFDIEATPIPARNIWMALNRHLPKDIRIIASQQVDDDFHSRYNAIQRAYRYEINLERNVLLRATQWYVYYPLDIEQLHQVTKLVLGIHDFSSFCYAGTETENMICNISSASWLVAPDGTLSFSISANRFLHHMVRMLVGNIIEVARGKWDIEYFTKLLEHPDSQAVTVSAPANGLVLMKVSYSDEMQPDWFQGQQPLASAAPQG